MVIVKIKGKDFIFFRRREGEHHDRSEYRGDPFFIIKAFFSHLRQGFLPAAVIVQACPAVSFAGRGGQISP